MPLHRPPSGGVQHMSSLQLLANQQLPVPIGSIGFDADGTLVSRSIGPLRFNFQFAGWRFDAEAESRIDGGRIDLQAVLGGLPYSIEGISRRIDVLAILEASRRGLPNGRIEIAADRRIVYRGERTITEIPTPAVMLSAVTEMVIDAQPWLSLVCLYLADRSGTAATSQQASA